MNDLTEHKIDLIEGAIVNSLNEDQLEEFDGLMESDSQFRTRFELESELAESLNDAEVEAFRAQVQKTIVTKRVPTKNWKGHLLRIAAVFVVVLGSFLLLNLFTGEMNESELAENFFEPYPMMSINRDAGSVNDLTAIHTAYVNGKYEFVINQYKEHGLDRINGLDKIYLASAFISTDQPESALGVLESISEKQIIYDAAQWYTAIALLKLNRASEALAVLNDLETEKGKYGKLSKQLIEDLE